MSRLILAPALRKRVGKLIDLAGTVHGNLRVIARGPSSKSGQTTWTCECSCGNVKDLVAYGLIHGATKHCGCKYKETRKASLKVAQKAKGNCAGGLAPELLQYKKGARGRGIEWSLTDREAIELMLGDCHYCGAPPSTPTRVVELNKVPFRNGIDRIMGTGGSYAAGQVVSCCSRCNEGKMRLSDKDFLSWAKRIATHQGWTSPEPSFNLVDIARDPALQWAVM